MGDDGKLHLVVLDGGAAEQLSRDTLRSRRARPVRSKTIAARIIGKAELRRISLQADLDEALVGPIERPRVRADCIDGPRPCPWVGCRHHLYLDTGEVRTDSLKFNWPDLEPEQLPESCSLDVADRGGCNLELLGDHMNLTRERARQLEERLITSPRVRGALRSLAPEGDLERPAVRALGGRGRPKAAAAPPPEPVEEDADDRGYRTTTIGLTDDEHLECARFGSIAGAYVLAGVPLRLAWDRANEWLAEYPRGDMPEGISLVVPERKTTGLGASLVTPPERRSEPPNSVEHLVPRSDSSGVDDGDADLPMVGSEALLPAREEGPQLLAPSRRPENRRKATPAITAAQAEPGIKEEKMSFKQQVFEALEKHGPTTSKALAEAMGENATKVNNALGQLMHINQTVDRTGGKFNALWSVGTGKSVAGEGAPAPAKTTAKTKGGGAGGKPRAAKSKGKTNGHASVSMMAVSAQGPGGAMKALFDQVAEQLKAEFEAKMAALQVLAK